MRSLEERIAAEGEVLPGGVLRVGSFFNHQIDTALMDEMGAETARLFDGAGVTKVLTIEASGIALAYAAASRLGVPMVFAKKSRSSNVAGETYEASIHSYTHGNDFVASLPKAYLSSDEVVLIIDDFLATGEAFRGLIEIVRRSGAQIAGLVAGIEKVDQGGGDALRAAGYRVESLAMIDGVESGTISFRR